MFEFDAYEMMEPVKEAKALRTFSVLRSVRLITDIFLDLGDFLPLRVISWNGISCI